MSVAPGTISITGTCSARMLTIVDIYLVRDEVDVHDHRISRRAHSPVRACRYTHLEYGL